MGRAITGVGIHPGSGDTIWGNGTTVAVSGLYRRNDAWFERRFPTGRDGVTALSPVESDEGSVHGATS